MCNMECADCCPYLGCEKFPPGFNSLKSEKASRKRGWGMEFHLSAIPCYKPDTGKWQLHG